jgi:hypothetical protein
MSLYEYARGGTSSTIDAFGLQPSRPNIVSWKVLQNKSFLNNRQVAFLAQVGFFANLFEQVCKCEKRLPVGVTKANAAALQVALAARQAQAVEKTARQWFAGQRITDFQRTRWAIRRILKASKKGTVSDTLGNITFVAQNARTPSHVFNTLIHEIAAVSTGVPETFFLPLATGVHFTGSHAYAVAMEMKYAHLTCIPVQEIVKHYYDRSRGYKLATQGNANTLLHGFLALLRGVRRTLLVGVDTASWRPKKSTWTTSRIIVDGDAYWRNCCPAQQYKNKRRLLSQWRKKWAKYQAEP